MSNDAGFSISSIGSSTITHNGHAFNLHNILLIPHIKKNLMSISKFVHDNHIFLEFHPNYSLVKDLNSKKVLLQGSLKMAFMCLICPWHLHV